MPNCEGLKFHSSDELQKAASYCAVAGSRSSVLCERVRRCLTPRARLLCRHLHRAQRGEFVRRHADALGLFDLRCGARRLGQVTGCCGNHSPARNAAKRRTMRVLRAAEAAARDARLSMASRWDPHQAEESAFSVLMRSSKIWHPATENASRAATVTSLGVLAGGMLEALPGGWTSVSGRVRFGPSDALRRAQTGGSAIRLGISRQPAIPPRRAHRCTTRQWPSCLRSQCGSRCRWRARRDGRSARAPGGATAASLCSPPTQRAATPRRLSRPPLAPVEPAPARHTPRRGARRCTTTRRHSGAPH